MASEALKIAEAASAFSKTAKKKKVEEAKERKTVKGAECLRAAQIPSMN